MSKRPRKHFNLEDSGDAEIGAHPCEYVSVGLRLEGDPAKIRQLLNRLKFVGSTTWPDYCYVNTRSPYGVQVYVRVLGPRFWNARNLSKNWECCQSPSQAMLSWALTTN